MEGCGIKILWKKRDSLRLTRGTRDSFKIDDGS